jgi:hypothetical protein
MVLEAVCLLLGEMAAMQEEFAWTLAIVLKVH